MSEEPNIPLLDHQLAADELAWVKGVYDDFAAARAAAPTQNPKDVLRDVLGRDRHRLEQPMELSGNGPWRGRNKQGRNVAAVFLPKVELHRHAKSRTDQFPMYVAGEADAFSMENGQPVITPVTGGSHFHNAPGESHAFLPKLGKPVPADWEIAFIAITPRNLREDTQPVPESVRAAYAQATGTQPPAGV